MKTKLSITRLSKHIFIFLLVAIAFVCSSHGDFRQVTQKQKTRIVIVEQQISNSQRFAIVRVDGVEFFVTDNATIRLGNCN